MRGRRIALAAGLSALAAPLSARPVPLPSPQLGIRRVIIPFTHPRFICDFDLHSAELALEAQITINEANHYILDRLENSLPMRMVHVDSVSVFGSPDPDTLPEVDSNLARRRAYTVAGALQLGGLPLDKVSVGWPSAARLDLQATRGLIWLRRGSVIIAPLQSWEERRPTGPHE